MNIRDMTSAFVIGTVMALLVDAALQNALAAVQSPGVDVLAPWWVIGRIVERSVWVAAALLAWFASPALSRALSDLLPRHHLGRAGAFQCVGRLMICVPLVWLAATWLVLAVKMTLVNSWGTEGRVFISSYYYSVVLLGYAPWAGAGLALLALSRHATNDEFSSRADRDGNRG
jgi:hypothetical protein